MARDGAVPPTLLRLADAVLGPSQGWSEGHERWRLRYAAVAATVAVVIVVRRFDAITTPQFWAEDGSVYFVENATLGFARAFARLYNEYPNLTQRFIALLGGLVPVSDAPRVYTSAAITLTALALASFSLPAWRHLVRDDALRVLFCVAAVCLPFDQEVLSTPTNVGWFLAIWLTLVSVMRLPHAPWRVALLTFGGCCAVLSTPLAPINLPLWLLRAGRGAVRGDRRDLYFALALTGALASVVLFTRGMGSNTSITIPQLGIVRITFWSWVNLASFRVASLVAPSALSVGAGPPQMLLTARSPIAYAVGAAVVVGLLGATAGARGRNLPSLLLALLLACASIALTLLGRCWLNLLAPQAVPVRYAVYPMAMLVLAIVVALDGLPPGLWRSAGTVAAIAALARAWAPAFVIPPFQDLHWERYAPLVERTLRDRCPVQLTVPMNPRFAPLRIAWGPHHPAQAVSPQHVVATVTQTAGFQQAFTSQCDGLTEVDLYLGTRPSVAPPVLALSIVDGTTSIATVDLALTDPGTAGWHAFCFQPIAGSAGRHLTVILHATSTEPDAGIAVFGERNGEASLGHGCAA
ncbi:MAG TPA: hypothetical protein VKH82_06830 [Candidatus Binatia bacterium]|nr:hypothetical protein [Candidatus Binatia bacterium]